MKFSADFQPVDELPYSIPPDCGLVDVYPSPVGNYLLIELGCPGGQTVLFLDSDTGSSTQPITDTDSHFLAWTSDGRSVYLKVDSLGKAHVVRMSPQGQSELIPVTEFIYDLSVKPNGRDFTFTFSRGLGQGSELWLARRDGKVVQQLYADPSNYLSFARYSPDGSRIAFIKIPDSQTPFTVGELWVMNADGTGAHKLSDADAGHGYAANWSPDGKSIAFVRRENPGDESANQNSDSLISNIYLVDLSNGRIRQVTHLTQGHAETPHWSPEGNTLAFTVVLNGRMTVQAADLRSAQIRSLLAEANCCAAWLQK